MSPTGVKGDPFPGAAVYPVGGAYITIPPNLQVQYMLQWNLSYQRQVGTNWLLTANYLGSVTRHIWGSVDVNYSIPNGATAVGNANLRRLTYLQTPATGQYYGDIQQTDDGANASYNAAFLRVEHRTSHHVMFLTTYTFSHCISSWDFAGELAGTLYQNPLNRAQGERGNCGYDHRQVFNTSMVATSPGVGSSAARMITKDWQISPIVGLFTGNPVMIALGSFAGGKDISLSAQGNDRPNVVLPGQIYPAQETVQEWFNPAAFACAGNTVQQQCTVFSGQFGNLARNAVYGPGRINFDMAVSRPFQFHERYKLEVRADFFNIMNHGNWSGLGTTITNSATFGQVTSFTAPRIIQMAMKFYF